MSLKTKQHQYLNNIQRACIR